METFRLFIYSLLICSSIVLVVESKNTKVREILAKNIGSEKANQLCDKVEKLKKLQNDKKLDALKKKGIILSPNTTTIPGPDESGRKGKNYIHLINKAATEGECIFKHDILLTEAQVDQMLEALNNITGEQLVGTGDQLLGTPQGKARGAAGGRVKRGSSIVSPPNNLKWPVWPGTIPYRFGADIPEAARVKIRAAFNHIWDRTCLGPTENPNASGNRILIHTTGTGCNSYVGMIGGEQDISLDSGCWDVGTASHELGHALGMFHEQERWDRDNYITVNWTNTNANGGSYSKETQSSENHYGQEYDHSSIMHYSQYSDCINCNLPTAIAKDPWLQRNIGTGNGRFTFRDIKLINTHYGCSCSQSLNCQHAGYANPAYDCLSCLCPEGFGGTYCDQPEPASDGDTTCGGVINVPNTWTNFELKVGVQNNVVNDDYKTCWWHLKAPAGKYIDIQVNSIGDNLDRECYWGFVTIKDGYYSWDHSGNRLCMASDYANGMNYYSTNYNPVDKTVAVIGVASRYNIFRIKGSFRTFP
uniref:Zinc metalloproteinase n=1 Tax=Acrobeloides nanus TaxID=290746 RepID=A0A914EAD6_9BILA